MQTPIGKLSVLFCGAWAVMGGAPVSPHATAATVTLVPSADTTLMEFTPFNNMGAVPTLAVGVTGHGTFARGLIRFDLAGRVSTNAVVTEAQLEFTVVKQSSSAADATFDLHRMKVSWGEGNKESPLDDGTGTGSAATAGEATWVARLHPLTFWSAGGADPNEDYEPAASASADVDATVVFTSTSTLVADVQSWVADPGSNFGWIIKGSSEVVAVMTARRLGAKEHSTAKPSLTITYTEPAVLNLAQITFEGAQICFTFEATEGKSYSVVRREQVNSGTWEVIQTIPADASRTVRFCDPIGTRPAFYRVGELSTN